MHQWIREVGTPEVVEEFLSSQKPISWQFLSLLSQVYEPDEVPSRFEGDPWLAALKSGHGELSSEDEIHLYTYLLARALGHVTENAGERAQFSFEVTDRAAANSQLPFSSWSQLERHLPWPPFWQD
jgi:hypothetical protein